MFHVFLPILRGLEPYTALVSMIKQNADISSSEYTLGLARRIDIPA